MAFEELRAATPHWRRSAPGIKLWARTPLAGRGPCGLIPFEGRETLSDVGGRRRGRPAPMRRRGQLASALVKAPSLWLRRSPGMTAVRCLSSAALALHTRDPLDSVSVLWLWRRAKAATARCTVRRTASTAPATSRAICHKAPYGLWGGARPGAAGGRAPLATHRAMRSPLGDAFLYGGDLAPFFPARAWMLSHQPSRFGGCTARRFLLFLRMAG